MKTSRPKPEANASSESLADLPNLGPVATQLLIAAGIRTPRALRRIGAVEAARRIRALRPLDPPCRHMLAALEGAVRGIPKRELSPSDRLRLWAEFSQA